MPAISYNWINNQAIPALSQKTLENINPATQAIISHVPASDASDIDMAVAAAAAALHGPWALSTQAQRAEILENIAKRIEENIDDLAMAESLDTGKPLALAKAVDIRRAIENFRFFADLLKKQSTAEFKMPGGAINHVIRKPLGVVGLITPWNLPLYLLSWKVAPALAMGNCIVAKPSELTPTTATMLAHICQQAGLPDGVFNIVHGLGAKAGQALVEHPQVKAISFTGGTETGMRVNQHAAATLKKVSLELGGKNATIVFADCDIEKAVHGALKAAFTNQGQICLSGSRVLIEESIFERFKYQFVHGAQQLTCADPLDQATKMGALVSLEHRQKVQRAVAQACKRGASLACGGALPKLAPPHDAGAFYPATVLCDVDIQNELFQNEIFGPVVSLHSFKTEKQALEMANAVPYGLSASVWSRNIERAQQCSRALDTGMVWINSWLLRDLRVPFGGVKSSGLGREGGQYSFDFFSELQSICTA